MKKRRLITLSVVALSGFVFASALAFNSNVRSFSTTTADTHSFQTGLCTEDEVADAGFTRNTENGNPIEFKFAGAYAYDASSVVRMHGGAGQACVYNVTPITGLKSLQLRAGTNFNYKVYYGNTMDAVEGYVELTSADFDEVNGATVQFDNNAKYFSIVHNPSSWNYSYIRNITITYACADENRGETFVAGTNYQKSLGNHPLTDTLVFDIKFNYNAENTHVNVFLGEGWTNMFGYYSIYANGLTGSNYNGIYVKKLSDGYVRVTAVLSELDKVLGGSKDACTKIDLLFMRGDWTTASGYIDVSPTVNVFENVVTTRAFTNVNPSRNIELSETVMLDLAFDPGQTDREYFLLGDGWSNYYGYYGIYASSDTGTLSNKDGIHFEVVAVAHFILTINISELTVTSGDSSAIAKINLVYLQGGKTGVFTVNVL